jgi:hypothetical protein
MYAHASMSPTTPYTHLQQAEEVGGGDGDRAKGLDGVAELKGDATQPGVCIRALLWGKGKTGKRDGGRGQRQQLWSEGLGRQRVRAQNSSLYGQQVSTTGG